MSNRPEANSNAQPRAAIVYHYFQHYRTAVFNALIDSDRYEYTFVADTENMYASGVEPWAVPDGVEFLRARCHLLPLGFMWQRGVVSLAFRKDIDAIVFFGNVYYLATWVCAILARLRGKRVVFWTQGWLKPDRGFKAWLRRRFYQQADSLLVYGHYAKQIGIDNGMTHDKFHVVYNSLDAALQKQLRTSITDERLQQVRAELFDRPELPIVTSVTRLIERRRLDWLLQAAAHLKRAGHEFNILIVGDGPEEARLKKLADHLKVPVRFYGPCYDERRLAELNLISCVSVAPGMVGLTAIQSFAYGVPVITQGDPQTQMPEAEAVIPGLTGDVFENGNPDDLAKVLQKWTRSPTVDQRVRAACHRIIDDFYNPESQRRTIERALDGLPADDLAYIRSMGN